MTLLPSLVQSSLADGSATAVCPALSNEMIWNGLFYACLVSVEIFVKILIVWSRPLFNYGEVP